MNREEFNKLEIKEQVEYFNNELKQENFNSICTRIGISKNTIKRNFNKEGYIEIKKGQIIKEFAIGGILRLEEIEEIKEIPGINLLERVELLEKEIEELKKAAPGLKELLKRIEAIEKENKEIKEVAAAPGEEFKIEFFDNAAIVKTFKIDSKMNDKLEEVIKKYKGYKKQDILNSLLNYAINNIK